MRKQKTAVIYISQPLDKNKISLAQQACVLKDLEKDYNMLYVHTLKTHKSINILRKEAGLDIEDDNVISLNALINTIYDDRKTSSLTHKQYHDNHSPVRQYLSDNDLSADLIINWGRAIGGVFKVELYETSKSMSYMSTLKNYTSMFSIHNLILNSSGVKYVEHILDPLSYIYHAPLEDKDIFLLHENAVPSEKIYRFDAYQKFLLDHRKRPTEEKEVKIVLGMSALMEQRYPIFYKMKKLIEAEGDLGRFYYQYNGPTGKKDTRILKNEYTKMVSRSEYTVIMPAYVETAFSITRLCEAVYHKCLPLFLDGCKLNILVRDFDIDLEVLKELTFTDELIYPTDERREELLDYFYNKLFVHTHADLTNLEKLKEVK